MAGGKKRPSESETGTDTRSAKSAKTADNATANRQNSKADRKEKKTLSASEFKAKALPLHVNLTHTPPSIPDEETVPAAPADLGSIGSVTLLPTSFSTGSYGWKGSYRVAVELQNTEGKEKEKVQVMFSINATVIGSKQAKENENDEETDTQEITNQSGSGDQNSEGHDEAGKQRSS